MAWRGMAWHEHEHEHGIKEEQIIRHPTRLCCQALLNIGKNLLHRGEDLEARGIE
jgi:hypothetical protein